jgi:transcriptional regulator with XRE-family HTH domain
VPFLKTHILKLLKNMKETGILLKETRESKKIKVKDVAKALKIRPQYVEMIESGDVSSVAGNININLYVKTYAKWLGLDSAALVVESSSEKTALPNKKRSVGVGLPSISIGKPFGSKQKSENSATEMARGNKIVAFLSLLMAIGLYAFWYNENNIQVKPVFEAKSNKQQVAESGNYANILATKGSKFLLVAKDKVVIRIKDENNNIVAKQLEIGEIYFLSIEKNSFLETDNPHAIEVVADDETSTSFGTLDTIATE